MKTKTQAVAFGAWCIALLGLCLLAVATAYATVGGPTLVYSFTYNPVDESVYYIHLDQGGRGCPPELRKISLATGVVSTIYSCDQGEALLQQRGTHDTKVVMEEISKITASFKNVVPIDLNKNGITVDVFFVRDEVLTPADGVWRRQFTAIVEQNNTKATEFALTGCSAKEPFLFSGYAIPGFDKKIVLLSSGKGDCMEGGYINESLHVVGGVTGLDKTTTKEIKGPFPLAESSSTLLVIAGTSVTPPLTTATGTNVIGSTSAEKTDAKPSSTMILILALLAIVAIALGFFAGTFTKKRVS